MRRLLKIEFEARISRAYLGLIRKPIPGQYKIGVLAL
jgi:hypothetical protein